MRDTIISCFLKDFNRYAKIGKEKQFLDLRIGDTTIRGLVGKRRTIGDTGYSYFEAVLHPGQLNDLAKAVEDRFPNLADELRKARDRSDSLLVSGVVTKDGEAIKLKAGKMGEAEIRDLADIRKGTQIWTGFRKVDEDTDKAIRDGGFSESIERLRAYVTAKDPNSAIVRRHTEDIFKYGEQALLEDREKGSQWLERFYKQHGRIVSSFNKSAGVQGGMEISLGTIIGGLLGLKLGAKGQADLSVNKQNQEVLEQNLLYYSIAKIQYRALEAAKVGGKIDKDVFREEYHKLYNQLYEEIKGVAEGKSPFAYGASGIIGENIEDLKLMYQEWKKKGGKIDFSSYLRERTKDIEASMKKAVEDSGLVQPGFYDWNVHNRK